jgi:hypothetical protein
MFSMKRLRQASATTSMMHVGHLVELSKWSPHRVSVGKYLLVTLPSYTLTCVARTPSGGSD